MASSGQKREFKEYVKYVGFFEANVIDINPDLEGLKKILGDEIEDEPKYITEKEIEDKDGNKKIVNQLIVSVWLEDVKTKGKFSVRFFLKDMDRPLSKKGLQQYINTQGASTWAVDEESIPAWFTKVGDYRKAKDGEAEFFEFIRSYLNQINHSLPYEITMDWKKAFNGNFKELRDFMKDGSRGTVLALATIKVDVDNDKEYQQVWNRGFGAGYLIKQIRTKKINDLFIENALAAKEDKKATTFQKLILSIVDKEYGVKEFYKLGELTEYIKEENEAATAGVLDTKDIDEDDSSY